MKLTDMTVNDFVKELGAVSPAPGGGSVAALCGGLSAALCAMVARLTLGREKYKNSWEAMAPVVKKADVLSKRLIQLVDEDTRAYIQVMEAMRMSSTTDDQKAGRKAAIEQAQHHAAEVPLDTLKTVSRLIGFIHQVVEKGNPNCITDAGTAVLLTRAAAYAAAYNVRINLGGIHDQAFVVKCNQEVNLILERINAVVEGLEEKVWSALG